VARCTGQNGITLPRSLRTVAAVRREAMTLYRQTKEGVVEGQLAGRLAHILQLLASLTRDHDFEDRIEKLEAIVAERDGRARGATGMPDRERGHDRRVWT
jgi:hypothetical protein